MIDYYGNVPINLSRSLPFPRQRTYDQPKIGRALWAMAQVLAMRKPTTETPRAAARVPR